MDCPRRPGDPPYRTPPPAKVLKLMSALRRWGGVWVYFASLTGDEFATECCALAQRCEVELGRKLVVAIHPDGYLIEPLDDER